MRKFKALSDSANYGISIIDEEGNYIYCNTHYAHMHGVEPIDIIGRRFPLFQKVSDAKEWDAWMATLLNYDESNVREVMHIHRDGHQFPVLMHTAPIRGHNQTPIFTALTAVDITDQKQQNEVLRRYANRLEALHQIDQAILESRSPEQLAAAAIGNLQKLVHLDHSCVIWTSNEDSNPELLALYNHPSITNPKLLANIEAICREMSLRNEEMELAVKTLTTADMLSPLEDLLKRAGIKHIISVPLQVNNELVGLLFLGTKTITIPIRKFLKSSRKWDACSPLPCSNPN